MGMGVVAQSVSLIDHLAHQSWISAGHRTHIEEGCLNTFFLQGFQNSRGPAFYGTIVKGEDDFLVAQAETGFLAIQRTMLLGIQNNGSGSSQCIGSAAGNCKTGGRKQETNANKARQNTHNQNPYSKHKGLRLIPPGISATAEHGKQQWLIGDEGRRSRQTKRATVYGSP